MSTNQPHCSLGSEQISNTLINSASPLLFSELFLLNNIAASRIGIFSTVFDKFPISYFYQINLSAVTTATMETILEQLKQAISTADETARGSIMAKLHSIAYSLEDVEDTVNRLSYMVSLWQVLQPRQGIFSDQVDSLSNLQSFGLGLTSNCLSCCVLASRL